MYLLMVYCPQTSIAPGLSTLPLLSFIIVQKMNVDVVSRVFCILDDAFFKLCFYFIFILFDYCFCSLF